jgi:RimJ/RimL family protein N-acetyltransferase
MVWIVEERPGDDHLGYLPDAIGMVSLRICGLNMGEYGRLFIDPLYQGQGYATEIEYNFLALSFEFFQLDKVWAELISDNAAIIALHKKTGWRTVGVDLPGHTHSGTPVILIEYDRAIWAERRQAFYASLNLDAPLWTI